MNNEQLAAKISGFLPGVVCEQKQYVTVTVHQNQFLDTLQVLKSNNELFFDYLITLTGVDNKDNFAISYVLTSSQHNHTIIVKVIIADKLNPAIDSVTSLWRTAEFQEREIYDLLGIVFHNHPDMRRIFLSDDWVGYPLRKDYKDEVNIVER